MAVSDQEETIIESPKVKERFGDIDVVLGCGDLRYTYLEYITTMLPAVCLYVHGNHDHAQYLANGRSLKGPGGWFNVDGRTIIVQDWIIGGLEGSIRYRPNTPFQYTEAELRRKMNRMAFSMMINRIFRGRFIDILITHAPPFGIHDGSDFAHRGFETLLTFMQRYKPRYLLHGHQHRRNIDKWHTTYEKTEVVNIFPYRRLELRKSWT